MKYLSVFEDLFDSITVTAANIFVQKLCQCQWGFGRNF
jgi:hypothetical protein